MFVNGLLVERVDLRRLGRSARGNDVPGDELNGCEGAAGEEETGSLGREGVRDGAADRTTGSVDHRDLVLQSHARGGHRAAELGGRAHLSASGVSI